MAYFTQQPPATLAQASYGIERLTGVTRSPAHVGKLLKRWGLKRRQVGALPGPPLSAARLAEQDQFRDHALTARLAQAQAGPRVVFFGRGALRLRSVPRMALVPSLPADPDSCGAAAPKRVGRAQGD